MRSTPELLTLKLTSNVRLEQANTIAYSVKVKDPTKVQVVSAKIIGKEIVFDHSEAVFVVVCNPSMNEL